MRLPVGGRRHREGAVAGDDSAAAGPPYLNKMLHSAVIGTPEARTGLAVLGKPGKRPHLCLLFWFLATSAVYKIEQIEIRALQ